ncbi:MAG: DUF1573 domain-containing protein [Peptococcaceae bacterium]|jgi:hypothetical protein|nr:DUF1573 domain-containing protein [Peptococcaceae bacterium]
MEQLSDQFQETVRSLLIRHQSILDILSKSQETAARVNRAVTKTVTNCGCLQINAHKKKLPENVGLRELKEYLDSNLEGQLCENCREIIESELGNEIFYIAALANALHISLSDVLRKEEKKLSTLTIFNLK